MTRAGFLSLGLILMGCLVACRVQAEDTPTPPAGTDRTDEVLLRYNLHPAFEKLGRGLGNTVGGWLELPLNIQKRYAPGDAASSIFTGAVLGLVKGAVRTGVGAYEVVTFWLPYPEHYAPILPTLEYFNRADTRREPLLLE